MDVESWTHAGAVVVRERDGTPEFAVVGALKRPQEGVLPKGHIESGETPEVAALRELREEAGIEGEVIARLGALEFDTPKEHVRAAFYLVRYLGEIPAAEPRRLTWSSFDEAPQHLAHADAAHLVDLARVEWLRHRSTVRGHEDN